AKIAITGRRSITRWATLAKLSTPSLPCSKASFLQTLFHQTLRSGKSTCCHEPRLLELNVCPERRHHYRPAVAVVAGIVDVLRPRSKIDSAPHVQRVIGFHDILPPVVQPAI